MTYLIKDLPQSEKPREKFKKIGVENLSKAELIAIILRTGTNKLSVRDLALKIDHLIDNYQNLTINNLMQIKGIGEVKAITLLAAIELGRRTLTKSKKKVPLNSAALIYDLFKYDLQDLEQENLIVLFLDTKKQLINYKKIFMGTINNIVVHQREVFYEAIKHCAVFIVMIHNHPSGDPNPSKADILFTKEVEQTGLLIKIPLIDHIIIGKNKYYSFYDNRNGE